MTTGQSGLVAGCLLLVIGVLLWPAGRRARLARLSVRTTGAVSSTGRAGVGAATRSVTGRRWPGRWAGRPTAGDRPADDDRSAGPAGRLRAVPGHWIVAGGGAAGLLTAALAGAVAGVVVGVYTGLAGRAWRRHQRASRAAQERARTLDALCALAADLRAGLPPVLTAQQALPPGSRIAQLTTAVWRLAEQTGAPAAELVERIEADARAGDRSRASAAAQAAGARATAMLLAALPLGGIALGYAIGTDPLRVLLHTPIGAGCTAAAIALQLAGMAWADRLAAGPPGAAG